MTLDELRALLTPERLDQVAAHNCGASDLALVLASALTDALTERDTQQARADMLTQAVAVRDRAIANLNATLAAVSAERDAFETQVAWFRAERGAIVDEIWERRDAIEEAETERDARPAITREDARLRSERFDLGLGAESMSDEMRRAEDRVDAALREHGKGGE